MEWYLTCVQSPGLDASTSRLDAGLDASMPKLGAPMLFEVEAMLCRVKDEASMPRRASTRLDASPRCAQTHLDAPRRTSTHSMHFDAS